MAITQAHIDAARQTVMEQMAEGGAVILHSIGGKSFGYDYQKALDAIAAEEKRLHARSTSPSSRRTRVGFGGV